MIYVILYLAAIVIANYTIAMFGPVVSPFNAFLLIGLDLVCRDRLHDAWQRRNLPAKMLSLIVAGGVLSYLLNPAAGQIAIASSVSFVLTSIADGTGYQLLRHRGWLTRSNVSNIFGAAVDSLVFPTLAFGVLMPEIVLMQFVAKVAGGAVWSLLLRRERVTEMTA